MDAIFSTPLKWSEWASSTKVSAAKPSSFGSVRMDSKAPVIDVSAGLVFRAGKLLITKRHDDAHLGGLWEFPGGKREPDESFEACLVRELREELGIEVAVGELVESLTQ